MVATAGLGVTVPLLCGVPGRVTFGVSFAIQIQQKTVRISRGVCFIKLTPE